ncbi:MAG: cobyric acid synthase [Rhodospirillaceae bacterium]|nr:cobyric acid synthase [Rhodospirillaceae bacterium]
MTTGSSKTTRALMFQGTGSDVGKSMLVAGLCRALLRRGLSVRPFKPQNMSNNAAVTADVGEIGRAQALQARASGVEPSVHMNPVLLKPESDTGAQIVVQGHVKGHARAIEYREWKPQLLSSVLESYERLRQEADIVLVEGAGSPAEINLRDGDIANMGFAEASNCPVVLIGDIDRGGVIASLVGTHAILAESDRARVVGYLINKFRGDARLFESGITEISNRTGWTGFGLVPWFTDAHKLPAEDAVTLDRATTAERAGFKIAVPRLSRIANFDDLDPLNLEPDVTVEIVQPGSPIPADSNLILIPGSKATLADLAYIRQQGWDIDILAHHRRGGRVLGLCGGYQMLGRIVRDPDGTEGAAGEAPGLGLLDVETTLGGDKQLANVRARHETTGTMLTGYEIHIGTTSGPDRANPFLCIQAHGGERHEGAVSRDGLVEGCYLHGLFSSDAFRRAYLDQFGVKSSTAYDTTVEATLDALAEHLEAHLDIDALLAAAG